MSQNDYVAATPTSMQIKYIPVKSPHPAYNYGTWPKLQHYAYRYRQQPGISTDIIFSLATCFAFVIAERCTCSLRTNWMNVECKPIYCVWLHSTGTYRPERKSSVLADIQIKVVIERKHCYCVGRRGKSPAHAKCPLSRLDARMFLW